jgi:hypothetical protein
VMHAGIGLVVLQSMYLQAVGRYPTLPGLGYKRHIYIHRAFPKS